MMNRFKQVSFVVLIGITLITGFMPSALANGLKTQESQPKENTMQQDKTDIQETVTQMVNAIDTKKWSVAKAQFATDVFVDYSSMNGQAGSMMKSTDLVDGWQKLLATVNTHHMLTNFEITVNGNQATSQSHVYASHTTDAVPYWDIFGLYLHQLEKQDGHWKITSKKLVVHGQKGNTNFLNDVSK